MSYLIVREHDDALLSQPMSNPDEAERVLAQESTIRAGALLLFRHGLLVAWARGGRVVSYRHAGDRTEVAA